MSAGVDPGSGGADAAGLPAAAGGNRPAETGVPAAAGGFVDEGPAAGVPAAGVPAVAGVPADEGGGLPAETDSNVVDLVAAAIRADTSDLDSYHRVLSATVSDLLPVGMVEVDRDRTMKDRMAGREGRATSIRIRLGDRTLELVAQHGRLVATVAREVRGVVISRQEISVAEWTQLLAQYLAQLAAESADARLALSKLLGGI